MRRKYLVRVFVASGIVQYIVHGYSKSSAVNGGYRRHRDATRVQAWPVPKGA